MGEKVTIHLNEEPPRKISAVFPGENSEGRAPKYSEQTVIGKVGDGFLVRNPKTGGAVYYDSEIKSITIEPPAHH